MPKDSKPPKDKQIEKIMQGCLLLAAVYLAVRILPAVLLGGKSNG
tara:strand:+ start:28323 stop:28457 length:135 start_codon:yes stop_codon:yes gene_type:complete